MALGVTESTGWDLEGAGGTGEGIQGLLGALGGYWEPSHVPRGHMCPFTHALRTCMCAGATRVPLHIHRGRVSLPMFPRPRMSLTCSQGHRCPLTCSQGTHVSLHVFPRQHVCLACSQGHACAWRVPGSLCGRKRRSPATIVRNGQSTAVLGGKTPGLGLSAPGSCRSACGAEVRVPPGFWGEKGGKRVDCSGWGWEGS